MYSNLLVLISPFLQLGPSYYVSVASLMLVLTVWNWHSEISGGMARVGILLLIVLFMPLPMLNLPSTDPNNDLLRIFREGVMFVILVGAIAGFQAAQDIPQAGRSMKAISWTLGFFLAMAVLQTLFYSRGAYFGIPEAYFAQESGTIANDLALYYSFGSLRPHATFSEPSYFGFVLLSFAVMILPLVGPSRQANYLLAAVLLAGLLSRSLAFFISIFIVAIVPLMFERGKGRGIVVMGLLVLLILALAFTDAQEILSRLFEARSGITADESTMARIFAPLAAAPGYLVEYPLGAPVSVVDRALIPFLQDRSARPEEIMHNAFFNLLFVYGVIGITLIAIVLATAKDTRIRLYLLACTMFNGAFLAVDKVAMIVLAIAMYEGAKRVSARRAGKMDRPVLSGDMPMLAQSRSGLLRPGRGGAT